MGFKLLPCWIIFSEPMPIRLMVTCLDTPVDPQFPCAVRLLTLFAIGEYKID